MEVPELAVSAGNTGIPTYHKVVRIVEGNRFHADFLKTKCGWNPILFRCTLYTKAKLDVQRGSLFCSICYPSPKEYENDLC